MWALLLLLACKDGASDEPADTGTLPVETGEPQRDTGLQPYDCADPAPPEPVVEDCNGACYPARYVGDGYCDDGGAFAPNFDCAAHQGDAGDC